MRHGYIKTAAATPYITVADCNANGNEIIRLIHEMERERAKVMVFPELCVTGFIFAETSAGQCVGDFAENRRRDCGCGCADLCGCAGEKSWEVI